MKNILAGVLLTTLAISAGGCTTLDKARRADRLDQEIVALRTELEQTKKLKNDEMARMLKEKNREIDRLLSQKDQQVEQVKRETRSELSELEKAKRDLENSLSKELKDYQAKLEMTERGLVVTFLAEIFFDSGRDVVRKDAYPSLQKVADVLKGHAIDSKVAVEGYTDNEPIQRSAWKSNWELSSGRALAVLHYFIDEGGIDPTRLSAIGYGEYHPVVSNDTAKGKQQNRRVEIVILPAKLEKIRK